VWWCPAEARTGLLSSLAGLAVSLGAAAAEEADVDTLVESAAKLCEADPQPVIYRTGVARGKMPDEH